MKSYELTTGYYVHNKRYVKVINPDAEDISAGIQKDKAYLVGGIRQQGYSCSILVNSEWYRTTPDNLQWATMSEEDTYIYININNNDRKVIESYQSPPGYKDIRNFIEDLVNYIANSRYGEEKYYELCALIDFYKQETGWLLK